MFGHQDDLSKFTTQVITNCIHNVPSMNLTLGEQKRDFIHIDDVVSAYCVLLKEVTKKSELFQEYELGAGNSVSIRYFVETVKELANSSMKLNFGALPYRDHEIMESQANISALNALGWNPQHSLEKRLTQTINWYKQDHTYTV